MNQPPWWLTSLLMIVTAVVTHFLTMWRETAKARGEWRRDWEKSFADQAKKVSDAAVLHYVSPDAVANTSTSAHLIVYEIKRLQTLLSGTAAKQSADSVLVSKAFRRFNDAISLETDFQDPARAARSGNDPIVERISAAEGELMVQVRKARVRK